MNAKLLLIFLLISVATLTQAESVFLKNGEIIEGSVVKEEDTTLELKLIDGKTKSLNRADVLRILFIFDYKNQVNIYLKTGEEISAYIVDEDASSYTYRLELNSNQEVKIEKTAVKVVTGERLTQIKLGLKVQTGSGALGAAGLYLQIKSFEFFLAPGIVYVPKDTESLMALPVKLQGIFYFLDLSVLETYLFVNAVYAIGLKGYTSQFGLGGGLGIIALKYFYAEGSYQTVFEKSGFTIGAGVKIPLTIF
jgi:hypothetical protein